jgi:predicted nucleic acid-binding protein
VTLVFNASPVIILAKAGLLDQLAALGNHVIVPQAVIEEVTRIDNPGDPARIWLENPSCSVLRPASPPISSFLAAWDLGAGETAVIAIAANTPDAVAVLDDLAARRCAQAHGIEVMGSLGLALLAKKRGVIPNVGKALDAIVAAGLFIAPRHLVAIREQAGE